MDTENISVICDLLFEQYQRRVDDFKNGLVDSLPNKLHVLQEIKSLEACSNCDALLVYDTFLDQYTPSLELLGLSVQRGLIFPGTVQLNEQARQAKIYQMKYL